MVVKARGILKRDESDAVLYMIIMQTCIFMRKTTEQRIVFKLMKHKNRQL